MPIIPGVYQLQLHIARPARIRIGALGIVAFSAGWYVYSGSARGGVVQRVRRHLGSEKRLHWHIDYLLSRAEQTEAFVQTGYEVTECELHESLAQRLPEIPGFGCSDCLCESHLVYSLPKPVIRLAPWDRFLKSLQP